jgi:hypothetical protein
MSRCDTGQEKAALSIALTALGGHLPRYRRSLIAMLLSWTERTAPVPAAHGGIRWGVVPIASDRTST